jgi:hypothetical protein
MAVMKIAAIALCSCALAAAAPWCEVKGRTGPAIQAAIDECAARGGGVAHVGPGEYVVGPLWLKDNVELRLEAGTTIALSQNQADWPAGAPAIVNANGARNIAITGRGTIDGRAQYEYVDARRLDVEIEAEMEIARKAGIEMKRYYRTGVQKYIAVLRDSKEIRIEGVRLVNSPLWTLRLQDCNQVWIRGVYIYSDLEKGVNADGIDFVSSSNVTISDSTIITADDAICVKTMAWAPGRSQGAAPAAVRPSENITVSNCLLSSSSTAMMIGTETHAPIRHVLFSNIVVRDSNKAFGINVQDGAAVSDVRYQNVTFELNRRHWNWWGSAEVVKMVLKKRNADSPLGRIENVTIDGAQGTARGASLIAGRAERPLKDITVQGLRVRMLPENARDKRATHALLLERVAGLTLRDVTVEWDEETPEPAWGSALALRSISGLRLSEFHGKAGRPGGHAPAILMDRVETRPE